MAFVGLGALFNMVLPKVCNGFRFDNPVVCGRIGGFQLFGIELLNLGKK